MRLRYTAAKPLVLLALAIFLFLWPGHYLPYIDDEADSYYSDAMSKAAIAYATCRGVNALVSVVKESHIQVEPAGLGVELAAGQVLDPLDDMTERASDILVTAIVSLGIQKVVYELTMDTTPTLIGIALVVFVVSSLLKGDRADSVKALMIKAMILVSVARLCLPLSALISHSLNDSYFSPKIMEAKDQLSMNSPEMERLTDIEMPVTDGVFDTIKKGAVYLGRKTSDLGAALKAMVKNAGNMVSNLLKLSYLYVALFVVQVILLPVGSFWVLVKLINTLLGTHVPCILKHAPMGGKAGDQEAAKEA